MFKIGGLMSVICELKTQIQETKLFAREILRENSQQNLPSVGLKTGSQ